MNSISLDQAWTFRTGLLDSISQLKSDPGVVVNLPHDGMIGTPVTPDAPARSDMGYFTGGLSSYTKYVNIPREWENGCVGLQIDGAMMNAVVEVNGCKAAVQHYGYAPFFADLTGLVEYGAENRITINVNTSMQPNSRWYTGSGLYRGVKLLHGPKIHIAPDGIYALTREVSDGYAFLEVRAEIRNDSARNSLVEAEVFLTPEGSKERVARATQVIQVNARAEGTARIRFAVADPLLWDAECPNLYRVHVRARSLGEFRTHLEPETDAPADESSVLFGIRTITADARRGLRINGKTIKLKGGCVHHDNGLLGSVSLYEAEARKVRRLKEVGFNAIRTAHNPPSAALIEACDRLGMYVFDEAFDAWGIAKRGGDYSQFFADCWEKDLTAFVRRDRSHPSVILWSTGNEIPERGGLNSGYLVAARLAEAIRRLDSSRLISNGICSLWSGLDDKLAEGQNQAQNAGDERKLLWEEVTEPFASNLDVVGYNYMEGLYEQDHELFPERVILGSENFPKEIGFHWPLVEKLPYVIGEFTWTAWDYLGEAGIGKAVRLPADDPKMKEGCWSLMPPDASPFPWRTANDADFDITGLMLPQGAYRSVVWGSPETFLYSRKPEDFGKDELITPWGFPVLFSSWNYAGSEGKPVEISVFSAAEEVELLLNGQSVGRKAVPQDGTMPRSVGFETAYQPGRLEAVSYTGGKEVSRAVLETTEKASRIRLTADKKAVRPDGHDLVCVEIELLDQEGRVVPDAELGLSAEVAGQGWLAGFGTGNPITAEDYTDNMTVSWRGRALAILRSGYESGEITLTVSARNLPEESVTFRVTE